MLCGGCLCNAGIGMFQESQRNLIEAMAYLKAWSHLD